MPWEVKKTDQCPASKPFGVFNKKTGSLNGRCHESRNKAIDQLKALYKNVPESRQGSELPMEMYNLVPLAFAEDTDNGRVKWIQGWKYGEWHHPIYGAVTMTPEKASRLVKNFHENVRGQEIPINYNHGADKAKGDKAAGWIRDAKIENDGIYLKIEFTETAKKEVDDGEWRYFSPEWYDTWTHPSTQEAYEDVLVAGGLTNQPVMKDMVPLNFSEAYEHMANEGGNVDNPSGESKEMEHSEPGTGNPPAPKTDEDGSQEKDVKSGSRRDSPPPAYENKEGSMEELDTKLREALGLDKDADIIKIVNELHEEVKPLREAAKAASEKRAFSEMYPEEAKELERLRKDSVDSSAKKFSERYERIIRTEGEGDSAKEVRTSLGFSGLALQKIEETHKKFSEGTASVEDMAAILDAVGQSGLVDYGERGSSRTDDVMVPTNTEPRKAFGEVVQRYKDQDNLDHPAAVKMAAEKHPDLFDAYRNAQPTA